MGESDERINEQEEVKYDWQNNVDKACENLEKKGEELAGAEQNPQKADYIRSLYSSMANCIGSTDEESFYDYLAKAIFAKQKIVSMNAHKSLAPSTLDAATPEVLIETLKETFENPNADLKNKLLSDEGFESIFKEYYAEKEASDAAKYNVRIRNNHMEDLRKERAAYGRKTTNLNATMLTALSSLLLANDRESAISYLAKAFACELAIKLRQNQINPETEKNVNNILSAAMPEDNFSLTSLKKRVGNFNDRQNLFEKIRKEYKENTLEEEIVQKPKKETKAKVKPKVKSEAKPVKSEPIPKEMAPDQFESFLMNKVGAANRAELHDAIYNGFVTFGTNGQNNGIFTKGDNNNPVNDIKTAMAEGKDVFLSLPNKNTGKVDALQIKIKDDKPSLEIPQKEYDNILKNIKTINDNINATGITRGDSDEFKSLKDSLNRISEQGLPKDPEEYKQCLKDLSDKAAAYSNAKLDQRMNSRRENRFMAANQLMELTKAAEEHEVPSAKNMNANIIVSKCLKEKLKLDLKNKDPKISEKAANMLADPEKFKKGLEKLTATDYFKKMMTMDNKDLDKMARQSSADLFKAMTKQQKAVTVEKVQSLSK